MVGAVVVVLRLQYLWFLGSGAQAQELWHMGLVASQHVASSLGREDSLEKGMATHSSIPAWRIFMDRGAWLATVRGVSKSQTQLSD